MTVQRETLLCRYHYDPLDRVASCVPLNEQGIQRYYRKERFATEVQGQVRHSLFEHEAQVLAQQRHEAGRVGIALLSTNLQRSVLHLVAVGQHQQPVYSPYGHQFPESSFNTLMGFNGERRDPVTGHYLLGNGYRAFNPVLMRFNSPDTLSPFGKGGVNAYAYCLGDPVNRVDPLGEFAMFARGINQMVALPVAALRQVWRGGRALKKAVVNSFNKAPGSDATTKAAMKELSKTDPAKYRKILDESTARAGELNLYEAGGELRYASKKVSVQESRRLKNKLFVEANNLPEHMLYKIPKSSLAQLRVADRNLRNVALEHTLRSPAELLPTVSLVALIRQV
jgi:RHS repeat-associated protein